MKHFCLRKGIEFDLLYFQDIQLTANERYFNQLCGAYQTTPKEYVEKANELFIKHNINIPKEYPKKSLKEYRLLGEEKIFPTRAFMKCIASCITIEELFDLDTSKIIKSELFKPNSRIGIYHACSMSMITLHYLNEGSEVIIPKEKKNQKNPDLIIDGYKCDIKTIDRADWTADIDFDTGTGKERLLSVDICYDIGTFIAKQNSGHKGIKQADIIFADLSLKSIGTFFMIFNSIGRELPFDELPDLKRNRIIYFSREIRDCKGFYIDFQPEFWKFIKETNQTYKNVISLPLPKKKIEIYIQELLKSQSIFIDNLQETVKFLIESNDSKNGRKKSKALLKRLSKGFKKFKKIITSKSFEK